MKSRRQGETSMAAKISCLNGSTALWIGAGIVVLAPIAAPVVGTVSKTVARAMFVGGLRAYRILKATAIATAEGVADLFEEARAELAETHARKRAKPDRADQDPASDI